MFTKDRESVGKESGNMRYIRMYRDLEFPKLGVLGDAMEAGHVKGYMQRILKIVQDLQDLIRWELWCYPMVRSVIKFIYVYIYTQKRFRV